MKLDQIQALKANPTPESTRRVPGSLPRNILYMAHGSADGKYAPTPKSAIITEVHPDDDQLVKVMVCNPTGVFFTGWLAIQYPDMPMYGDGGTVFWPVFGRGT